MYCCMFSWLVLLSFECLLSSGSGRSVKPFEQSASDPKWTFNNAEAQPSSLLRRLERFVRLRRTGVLNLHASAQLEIRFSIILPSESNKPK